MAFFTKIRAFCGEFFLESDGVSLVRVAFSAPDGFSEAGENCPVLRSARGQFAEYFAGTRKQFNLPIAYSGSFFREKVWAALREIPYGETRTYGEIAEIIGAPGASRAVGAVNHVNPLPIVVPCHRVVGADGKLVGYAGGTEMKRSLLEHERHFSRCGECGAEYHCGHGLSL